MGRATSPVIANAHSKRQHHCEMLLTKVTHPRRGQRWCRALSWSSKLCCVRDLSGLSVWDSKEAVTADLWSHTPVFPKHIHPCPGWGGLSANAARLMTEPERAHPRHHGQWEHMNKYTLTCHSFPDRVPVVMHNCSYILKHLGKNFFPPVKMDPHFARGELHVRNTLWKDPSFSEEMSPFLQHTMMLTHLGFFYLASYVVMGKKPNPNQNVVFS